MFTLLCTKFEKWKYYLILIMNKYKLPIHWGTCLSILLVRTPVIHASDSHRCVGTLEAPTSYGNNRLCLRAVGARKLVEILIKGAILSVADCGSKYELHPRCSRLFILDKNERKRVLNRTCMEDQSMIPSMIILLLLNKLNKRFCLLR